MAFEVVSPAFDEAPSGDPLEHAAGKARSVDGGGRPVLGVDTVVECGGERLGKPADAADARRMLWLLSGATARGRLGSLPPGPAEAGRSFIGETTRVTFRTLADAELTRYVEGGEWEGRAGGYAIQGLGASLVERIDGDYLNVVGLPAAVLVRLLASRFPGEYGFG